MSLCFFPSQLWFILHGPSKPAKQLFYLALTAHNHHFTGDAEPDYYSNGYQSFTDYEKPPNLVGLDLVAQLQWHGSYSNPYYLNKVVSFCAKSAYKDFGIQVHCTIIKLSFTSNVYVSSAVVDMYAKCGEIHSAKKMFDEMPQRNEVTWNSLISGYLNVGFPQIAVEFFVEMLGVMRVVTPSSVLACLVGCSQLEARELGVQVHGLSVKAGFGYNVVVGTVLIDMYSKCGNVNDSQRVFDHMADKNVVTWTSLVTAYAQNGYPDEAIMLVREMTRLGLKSNYVTYNSLLSSFSGPKHLDYCKQVHCCIIRHGFESNVYIAATLLTVYSKCSNNVEDFKKLRSGVTSQDHISWNAIISGLSNLGYGKDALHSFFEMRQAGIIVDFYTFTSVLGAIGGISVLEEGRKMHTLIVKMGFDQKLCIQNGLVSMYARCGALNDSKRVFWLMEDRDVISWNALLTGCAHHGYGEETLELFEQLRKTKIKPDSTTFLAVLSACSHAGFVDQGLEYFDLMRSHISIESHRVEHYASVVDIFGRAGCLNEAEAVINSMPIAPGPSVYKALLSACLVHGNREIAARTAKMLLELWPNDPATYILLSNVLKTGGCWNNAADVRKLMFDRGVRKKPGYSWI
ncbi:hypothetical protein P3X46_015631 [Hevea brasiliensis]|uniref:Pentacotripeptide-repeat region of PRORP domain-containing protein n=1 Tax=Hevea brasiliensis TaxID=3981 RepID=A0ABQ9M0K8_HEVBR|nr:pentatricopeptide repeat-containing protein At1g11290, chloroplastic-like [Hevea brasiliensis]KAJ9172388.1 hypothetical protein P3X46_015631 [Hevea brasiliensis]